MKAAKTWCLAGLLLVSGFSSASCGGKDEGLNDGDNPGDFVEGGADQGGTGGTPPMGRAGAAVIAGTGGVGTAGTSNVPGASPTKLGRGCMADADCSDAEAPGLKCVTDSLGDGAPPGGLCTIPCELEGGAAQCAAVGPGALCFPFETAPAGEQVTDGYCVEGCAFGEPELGVAKCHNRIDFACNPALLADTEEPCTNSMTDCNPGEICSEGTCNAVFAACLPSCRGDLDCADGTYCDQSFLGGLCVDEKPLGKALGEPCTVPGEDEPGEPDGCLGFCQADAAGSSEGHCVTNCGLNTACSWNSETEKFDGACLYVSGIDPNGVDGDFGFCMPACSCTDECNDPTLKCTADGGELPPSFKGPGLCYPGDEDVVELNECTDTGTGGAGGAGSTPEPGSGGEGGGG